MKTPFNKEPEDALNGVPVNDVARLLCLAPTIGKPGPDVLAGALRRISVANKVQRRRWTAFSLGGWAAAAALGGLLVMTHMDRGTATPELDGKSTVNPGGEAGASSTQRAGDGKGSERFPSDAAMTQLSSGKPKTEIRTTQRQIAVPDAERLKQEVERLRAAKQARELASPHLSRTVVVEMTDPAIKIENQRLGQLRLTDRVAESIAAGVGAADAQKPVKETENELRLDEKSPLVLSGGDGSWNGEIVIESGLPNTGLLNLPAGTTVRHLDFPVEDAASYRGLHNLGSGWFYDQFSHMLWRPTGEGNVYAGERAPEGFDVETFAPPGAVTRPVPPSQPQPEPALLGDAEPGTAPDAPLVRAYPIYDETTGSGSIILQNLPAPAEGQAYQLWVYDSATPTPISIGMIPLEVANGDRVWFDLGGPGVMPTRFSLTIEPITGSRLPSGRVILQGP